MAHDVTNGAAGPTVSTESSVLETGAAALQVAAILLEFKQGFEC